MNRSGGVQVRAGLAGDAEDGAVGGVQALALPPLPVAAIRFGPGPRGVEGALLDDRERAAHLADHADLVPVLEMRAHAVQAGPYGDAVPPQLLGRSDARKHQQLRRVEGAGGQDHLTGGDDPARHRRTGVRAGIGPVGVRPVQVVDAGRRVPFVQDDPGRQRVRADRQMTGVFALHGPDAFAYGAAAARGRGEGDLPQPLQRLGLHPPVVGVGEGTEALQGGQRPVEEAGQLLLRGGDDDLQQLRVLHGQSGIGQGGGQPAVEPVPGVVAVPGRHEGQVAEQHGQERVAGRPLGPRPVGTAFQPLEVPAHGRAVASWGSPVSAAMRPSRRCTGRR
ncbi:hypothetical protein GCM10017687_63980 [Streptomyces echinatus]